MTKYSPLRCLPACLESKITTSLVCSLERSNGPRGEELTPFKKNKGDLTVDLI